MTDDDLLAYGDIDEHGNTLYRDCANEDQYEGHCCFSAEPLSPYCGFHQNEEEK